MGIALTPAAVSAEAVPPVEMISTPMSTRPLAKATRSVLSLTEINARRMGEAAEDMDNYDIVVNEELALKIIHRLRTNRFLMHQFLGTKCSTRPSSLVT